MPDIQTNNTLADRFLNFSGEFFSMQIQQNAMQSDYIKSAVDNASALTHATNYSANQYFYGLANQQTTYLNQMSKEYAKIGSQAINVMDKLVDVLEDLSDGGGFLGLF